MISLGQKKTNCVMVAAGDDKRALAQIVSLCFILASPLNQGRRDLEPIYAVVIDRHWAKHWQSTGKALASTGQKSSLADRRSLDAMSRCGLREGRRAAQRRSGDAMMLKLGPPGDGVVAVHVSQTEEDGLYMNVPRLTMGFLGKKGATDCRIRTRVLRQFGTPTQWERPRLHHSLGSLLSWRGTAQRWTDGKEEREGREGGTTSLPVHIQAPRSLCHSATYPSRE